MPMKPSEFDKYLSDEALARTSVSIRGRNLKDVDQQAYVMLDGTVITIEKSRDKLLVDACLENPLNIKISCSTRVSVKYEIDGEEKSVKFIAENMQELCSKWKVFKTAKQYDPDLVGVIEYIDLTVPQQNYIIDIEDVVNDLLNYMLDTDLVLNNDMTEEMDTRYRIINQIITNTANFIIVGRISDKVHIPHLKRSRFTGQAVEANEYLTADMFFGEEDDI